MKKNTYKYSHTISNPIIPGIALLISTVFLSSCTANAGYRHHDYKPAPSRSIEYHYFPNAHVYYDSHRRVYHYQHKQRGWLSVKKLPKHIHIDKHRRYSVRSDHRKPWKNQHLLKKHRSHVDKHFDRNDKNALKRRHPYQSHSPRHAIKIHQTQHNHGTSRRVGNRQQKKHMADVSTQRRGNGQRVLKRDHENDRRVNKFTDRKVDNKHTTNDKKESRKMQNKQQHRKSEPRRADSKQNKDRVARSDGHSRQKGKQRRN